MKRERNAKRETEPCDPPFPHPALARSCVCGGLARWVHLRVPSRAPLLLAALLYNGTRLCVVRVLLPLAQFRPRLRKHGPTSDRRGWDGRDAGDFYD